MRQPGRSVSYTAIPQGTKADTILDAENVILFPKK